MTLIHRNFGLAMLAVFLSIPFIVLGSICLASVVKNQSIESLNSRLTPINSTVVRWDFFSSTCGAGSGSDAICYNLFGIVNISNNNLTLIVASEVENPNPLFKFQNDHPVGNQLLVYYDIESPQDLYISEVELYNYRNVMIGAFVFLGLTLSLLIFLFCC